MREKQCILHKHVLNVYKTKFYRILERQEDSSNQNSLRFRFSEEPTEKKISLVFSMKFSKCACDQDGT